MSDVNAGLPATLTFRLGYLGTKVADLYAARIAELGLKQKHVGMLIALSGDGAASQQEMAARMEVAPSLVVALADHLENLGALRRVRDADDRRRQVLTLTDRGRELLTACEDIAHRLDGELAAELGGRDRAALHRALGTVGTTAGLPLFGRPPTNG
ncbi:MarR family winged helix-turn-helix transcriptional regulator [Nocardia blacklockiae]|uniref:MarR family winged helix-turn-helix transcriptional regulator n=1 Tax=Nocardia blacklockiae TaxID=480036 RepID=UPI002B4AE990|nr:MarR family winged helix-turn-helix transcriptional regulator [Nocardia blacklockiae]